MSKNAQHQWEPVAGPDNLVRCKKCGSEVKASRARRGVGPCIWGDSGASVPIVDAVPPSETPGAISEQSPEVQALIAAAAVAAERFTPEELEAHAKIMNETNLCEDCHLDIATCDSDPVYGTGPGNDNVIACDAFRPASDEPPEAPQYPGPRLVDPPENCNGCGDRLAILPLNSRLDMVACNNGHCALYRERLRMVTKPTKRGKRKRGNNN